MISYLGFDYNGVEKIVKSHLNFNAKTISIDIFKHTKQVLLVVIKKWLICDINLSLICLCIVLWGIKKNILLVQNKLLSSLEKKH